MDDHDTPVSLSKGFYAALALSGLVAGIVYYMTLSTGVFPGYPAALTAEAAGLMPSSGAAHPLFSWLARWAAAGPVADMPLRVNLVCTVCGVLCGMLLGYLTAKAVLRSAGEEAGGEGVTDFVSQDEDDAPDDTPAVMSEEVQVYNRKVRRIALLGGLVANLLLAFTAPVWAASVRADNGVFNLLLALLSFALFPAGAGRRFFVRLTFSAFLFTLGVFESPVFLVLAPYYAFVLFRAFLLTDRRKVLSGCLFIAVASGVACAYAAAAGNTDNPADFASQAGLLNYAHALVREYLYGLRSFFPGTGWLLVLIQVGVPAVILLFGRPTLFKERRASTFVAILLMTACALPGLLHLPFSSARLFMNWGRPPVFSYAVLAAAAAMALAACLVFLCRGDQPEAETDEDDIEPDIDLRRLRVKHGVAGTLAGVLLLLALAAPWRGWREVDPRPGRFADRVAQELLSVMRERVCLISNGILDNHLLIQAYQMGKPLTLITLRTRPVAQETDKISRLIRTSPLFEGLNRPRLQNALNLSTVRFVMEWLKTDPRAGERVMVFSTPELWAACGYRAVPETLAFGGTRDAERALDLDSLIAQNKRFAEQFSGLLADEKGYSGLVDSLRAVIRMKTAFAANELGVMLEDAGRHTEAFDAYQRAAVIDPRNVSAAQNSFALADAQKLFPQHLDVLRKQAKSAWASCWSRSRDLTAILQSYGTIRHPALYEWQRAVWSTRGAKEVASDKKRKALSMSERTGAAASVETAWICQQAGEIDKAESSYMAALGQDASNKEALTGLCMLMLAKKDVPAVEQYLSRARAAGVSEEALRYPTVMVLVLKKDPKQGQALEEATKRAPSDVRYWTLLADFLLEQGETQKVEFSLVPAMLKAMKVRDHVMAHAIRGMVLWKKGPSFYREARQEFLKTLDMNAALPDIWNSLLELDLAINNAEFTESDARKCLCVDPDNALASYLLGSILLSRGELKASEDFLRRSIGKVPTAAACNDLGDCLRLQHNLAEAERYARQSLAIDPKFIPALDTLANILFDSGNYGEASKLASKAVDAKPDRVVYQLTLLRAQIKQGDKDGVYQRLKSLDDAQASIPETLQREIKAMK